MTTLPRNTYSKVQSPKKRSRHLFFDSWSAAGGRRSPAGRLFFDSQSAAGRLSFGCDQTKMNEWLVDMIDMREQNAQKVTVGLAEKAEKILPM